MQVYSRNVLLESWILCFDAAIMLASKTLISINLGNLDLLNRRYVKVIEIKPNKLSLSNKTDNSLLAVRDINHKYIVVE